MSVDDCLQALIQQLKKGCDNPTPTNQLLNFVITDSKRGGAPSSFTKSLLKEHSIQLIDTPLFDTNESPYYDNLRLTEALLSLS